MIHLIHTVNYTILTNSSISNSLITVLNIFLTFLGEFFRKREYSKDEGKCLREYGDSFIKDNYIFDHYVSDIANYISVEVDENEYPIYGNSKKEIRKSYRVSILVTLTDTSELDTISIILGNIATELYPDRSNYRNTVYSYEGIKQLIRAVQFTIR